MNFRFSVDARSKIFNLSMDPGSKIFNLAIEFQIFDGWEKIGKMIGLILG